MELEMGAVTGPSCTIEQMGETSREVVLCSEPTLEAASFPEITWAHPSEPSLVMDCVLEDPASPEPARPEYSIGLLPNSPHEDGPASFEEMVTLPPASFVSTTRGAGIAAQEQGAPFAAAPSNQDEFRRATSHPLPSMAAPALPPCRRRRIHTLAEPPRRSERLAKKSRRRTPALVAAQNVLLRKLGITVGEAPESTHIDQYIRAFREGLTEEQARMITELFVEYIPETVQDMEADDAPDA